MRDWFVISILIVIMFLNLADVFTDIHLEVPLWHVIGEAFIVVLSALTASFMLYEMRKRSVKLSELTTELTHAENQVSQLNQSMQQARHQFGQAVHQQFDLWKLSKSEQQVAMLLLKGLSFKEIAVVRKTKEKTVRQQASTIYAKSGLDGRHSFSAWFLEDFINPSAE